MGRIRYIEPPDRMGLAPLFARHRHLRAGIDGILQGHYGLAVADAGREALVAQLTIGVFTFFAGDPAHPVARNLVERLSGDRILVLAEDSWRDAVQRAHGTRIQTEQRLSFSSDDLDLDHLRSLRSRVPEGIRIERINVALAQRMRAEVSPDLLMPEVFATPAEFVKRGVGFCAAAGRRLLCAATSALICDDAIEIQINTNEAFRCLGLATAVGATLIVHCLEHGMDPGWDTGCPVSERVAGKLGYLPDSAYEWLVLAS